MKRRNVYMAMFAAAALFGAGCSMPGLNALETFVYDNADQYTMGGAELDADGIGSLDIGWVSGEIKVEYHKEDTVVISETANQALTKETTMYYLVDGDTLRVKFAKSGKYRFGKLRKELTVWLPEGMELENLAVDSVSADVSAAKIAAKCTEVNTTSGDVEITDMISKQAELDTTSGEINAKFSGELERFSANSVSGDMEFFVSAEEIELNTTSGTIGLSADSAPKTLSANSVSGNQKFVLPGAGRLELNATSGKIELRAKAAPDEMSVDTVSGKVVLCLPEDADFTVCWDTVSGSVNTELAMKKEKDNYIFGAGTKKYNVETTSGDLRVECE